MLDYDHEKNPKYDFVWMYVLNKIENIFFCSNKKRKLSQLNMRQRANLIKKERERMKLHAKTFYR
jgi:ribosomal protein L24E